MRLKKTPLKTRRSGKERWRDREVEESLEEREVETEGGGREVGRD